jgi:hypothetical protein
VLAVHVGKPLHWHVQHGLLKLVMLLLQVVMVLLLLLLVVVVTYRLRVVQL